MGDFWLLERIYLFVGKEEEEKQRIARSLDFYLII